MNYSNQSTDLNCETSTDKKMKEANEMRTYLFTEIQTSLYIV